MNHLMTDSKHAEQEICKSKTKDSLLTIQAEAGVECRILHSCRGYKPNKLLCDPNSYRFSDA